MEWFEIVWGISALIVGLRIQFRLQQARAEKLFENKAVEINAQTGSSLTANSLEWLTILYGVFAILTPVLNTIHAFRTIHKLLR